MVSSKVADSSGIMSSTVPIPLYHPTPRTLSMSAHAEQHSVLIYNAHLVVPRDVLLCTPLRIAFLKAHIWVYRECDPSVGLLPLGQSA